MSGGIVLTVVTVINRTVRVVNGNSKVTDGAVGNGGGLAVKVNRRLINSLGSGLRQVTQQGLSSCVIGAGDGERWERLPIVSKAS